MNEESTGPSKSTLRMLAGMLPGFKKTITHNVKSSPKHVRPRPRQLCKICCSMFDFSSLATEENEVKSGICPKCQHMLDEGNIAVICEGRYAFIASGRLSDMNGQIMNVEPEVMDQIEKRFTVENRNPPPAP